MNAMKRELISKIIYGTFLSQAMIKTLMDAQTIHRNSKQLVYEHGFKYLSNPGNEILYKGIDLLDVSGLNIDCEKIYQAYDDLTLAEACLTNDLFDQLPFDLKRMLPQPSLRLIGNAFDKFKMKNCRVTF